MKFAQSKQDGFSLVETLVAITILLLVIIGPMTISSSAARGTSFSSEQVIAFFLAQEGAEIVQKARDDLLLANFADPNAAWADFADSSGFFADCYDLTNGCGIELLSVDSDGGLKTPIDCSVSCKLYFDVSGERDRYTYVAGGNETTPYTRVVTMEETAVNQEVKVTSRVKWRTGSRRDDQEVVVETYLSNVFGF